VCNEWYRRSFQLLPQELANHRNPKDKSAAKAAAIALIVFLKKKQEEGNARHITIEDTTVGEWIEKFPKIETSPRTGINNSKNRSYSFDSVENYMSYWTVYIKGDPLMKLKMTETEEEDVLDFTTRMSAKKLKDGRSMAGTRTFVGVIVFVRMAFKSYQRKNRRWINPFQFIDAPSYDSVTRDILPEDEFIKLFSPGVFMNTMELAVCAAMFLSGLRRSEIYALKPKCLDWHTPKIKVRNSWQSYNKIDRVLGPTKGKRVREAPFDPILQEAIKKLWEENGKHEYVFCRKNGKTPGSSWINRNFPIWLERAGIKLDDREIVPHCSRHSLASLLEEKGVPERHIQELLGHTKLKTTRKYLHSTEKTIRVIGKKISDAMEQVPEENKVLDFRVS
jgi:integrase